jgi:hypothetical protein
MDPGNGTGKFAGGSVYAELVPTFSEARKR